MLDFSDQPYRWFPPRSSVLARWSLLQLNRVYRLPRVLGVSGVELRGIEHLPAIRGNDILLITPNHPTHTDAPVLLEAMRILHWRPQIMAAYDVFLRSRLDAWVMQRLGAFSVDREGSDSRAIKQAMTCLTELHKPLVIFPEGNVYLRNDRVTPFHDGAAFIALRAVKELAGQDYRVVCLPVSLKASYTSDVRPAFRKLLRDTATKLGHTLNPALSPAHAVRDVGMAALLRNLKQRGIDTPKAASLADLIAFSADAVLGKLEVKLDIAPKPTDSITDRVRNARRIIHEVRSDPERAVDHAAATGWADEAMLAFRIASYAPDYMASRPTVDRVCETIEKIWEDLFRVMLPPQGDRHVVVQIGTPIAVDDRYTGLKTRQAVAALTGDIERSVQAGLDGINELNAREGGKMWGDVLG
jgi:1-acyl-sn-glycerol-3-phosphate acyltransferase